MSAIRLAATTIKIPTVYCRDAKALEEPLKQEPFGHETVERRQRGDRDRSRPGDDGGAGQTVDQAAERSRSRVPAACSITPASRNSSVL